MLFDTLKRAITRKNYTSKEELAEKLSLLYSAEKISILFANDQLTQSQYEELMAMLEA